MLKALALASLFVAILLGGCVQPPVMMGGKPRPKVYFRVVSLSPSVTEILVTKAYNLQLVGRTAACNRPIVQTHVPVVMKGVKPNYEMITNIHPDLVVYDPDLFSQADIDKFKDINIETYAIKGDTIDEFIDSLYRFAAKVGSERDMTEYNEQIFTARTNARANVVKPTPRVAIIMPGKGTEHMIAGVRTFQADVLRAAGWEPVGPDTRTFVTANAENLIRLNPDVIFTAGDATPVLRDPRLKPIAAIRNHHIASVDPDILLRRGSSVPDLIKNINVQVNLFMAHPESEGAKQP